MGRVICEERRNSDREAEKFSPQMGARLYRRRFTRLSIGSGVVTRRRNARRLKRGLQSSRAMWRRRVPAAKNGASCAVGVSRTKFRARTDLPRLSKKREFSRGGRGGRFDLLAFMQRLGEDSPLRRISGKGDAAPCLSLSGRARLCCLEGRLWPARLRPRQSRRRRRRNPCFLRR